VQQLTIQEQMVQVEIQGHRNQIYDLAKKVEALEKRVTQLENKDKPLRGSPYDASQGGAKLLKK
jgi:phage shock protein A